MGKRIADTFSTVSASGEEYPIPRRPRLTDRNPIISAVQSGQRVSTLKLVAAPVELENQTVQIKIAYNHSHGVPSDADVFQFVRSEFPAMDIVDGQYRPGVITLFIRRAEDGITRSVDDGDTLSTEEIEGTGKIAAEGDKPKPKAKPPVRVQPWRAQERAWQEQQKQDEAKPPTPPAEAGASATPSSAPTDDIGAGRYVTQPSKTPFKEYIPSGGTAPDTESRPGASAQDDPSYVDIFEEESDLPRMHKELKLRTGQDEKGLLNYVQYSSPNEAVEVVAVRDDGEPPKFEKHWRIFVKRGVDPESALGKNPDVQSLPKFKMHDEEHKPFASLAHGLLSTRVQGAIKAGLALDADLEEIKRGKARQVSVSKMFKAPPKEKIPQEVTDTWHTVTPPGQTGGLIEEATQILKAVGNDEWRARKLIDKMVSQDKITDIKGKNLKDTVSKVLIRRKIPSKPQVDDLTAEAERRLKLDPGVGGPAARPNYPDRPAAFDAIDLEVKKGIMPLQRANALKLRIEKILKQRNYKEVGMDEATEEPLRPEPESKYNRDYSEPGGFGHKNPKSGELVIKMGQAAAPPAPGGAPGSEDLLGLLPGDDDQPGQEGPVQPGEEGPPGTEGDEEGGGLDLSLTDALESAQQAIDTIRENVEGGDAVIEGQELEHVPEAPAAGGPPIAPSQAAAQPITARKKSAGEDGDGKKFDSSRIPAWVRSRATQRIPKEDLPTPPPLPPSEPEPQLAPVGESSFVGTVFPVSSHWSDEEVEAAADIRKIIRAVFNQFGVNSWEDYEAKVPPEARESLRNGLNKASQNLNGRIQSPARLQTIVGKLIQQLDDIENKPRRIDEESEVYNAEGTTSFFEPTKKDDNVYRPSKAKLMPKSMSLATATNEDLVKGGFVSPADDPSWYSNPNEFKFKYLDQLANTPISGEKRTKRVKDRYDVAQEIVLGEKKAIEAVPGSLRRLIEAPYKPNEFIKLYGRDPTTGKTLVDIKIDPATGKKVKVPVPYDVRELTQPSRYVYKSDKLVVDTQSLLRKQMQLPPDQRNPELVRFLKGKLEELAKTHPPRLEEIKPIRAQRPGQGGDYLDSVYHWDRLRKDELDLVKDLMVKAIADFKYETSQHIKSGVREAAKKRDEGGWSKQELQRKQEGITGPTESDPILHSKPVYKDYNPQKPEFEQGKPRVSREDKLKQLQQQLKEYLALPSDKQDLAVILSLGNQIDQLNEPSVRPEIALSPDKAHEQFLSSIPGAVVDAEGKPLPQENIQKDKQLQVERLTPSIENIKPPTAIAPSQVPGVKPGRGPTTRTLNPQQSTTPVPVDADEALDPNATEGLCLNCKVRRPITKSPDTGNDVCNVCKKSNIIKLKPGYGFGTATKDTELKRLERLIAAEQDPNKLEELQRQLKKVKLLPDDQQVKKFYKTVSDDDPNKAQRYKWSDVPVKPPPTIGAGHPQGGTRLPSGLVVRREPGRPGGAEGPVRPPSPPEDDPLKKKSNRRSKEGVDESAKEYWEEYMDGYGRQMVEDPDLRVTTRSAFVIKIAQELGIQASEDQIVAIVETLENRPTGDGAFLIWAAEGGEPSLDQMVDLALEKGQTDSSVMKAIDRLIGTWMLRAQIAQPLTPEQQRRLLLQAISHDSSLRSRFRRLFRKTLGQPATTEGIDAGMPDAVGAAIGVTAAKFKMPSIKGKGKDSVKDVLSLDDIGDDRDIAPAGHICFAVDGVTNTGVYTRLKITWAPEDVNVSDASLHHAIKNFIKGLESKKVSGMDFGYIGFITIEDCDPKAGTATAQFRAKRPVGPMQVVES